MNKIDEEPQEQDKIEDAAKEEVLEHQPTRLQEPETKQQDEQVVVRFSDLHPVEEKVVKSNSLEFDIKLGWIPRAQITGPIPTAFAHPDMDDLLSEHIDPNSIVYLGYRPTNTFQIHKNFYGNGQKYPFNQFHLCKTQFLQRFFRRHYSDFEFDSKRKQGMLMSDSPLQFDSFFQGGNLDFVYRTDVGEYRLGVRPDTNTRGHCNYFHFKVTCSKPGKYYFRIVNMSKQKSLYERGLKPYVKTKKDPAWKQGAQNIRYGKSPLYEQFELTRPMYSLKFQYQFTQADNQVQFCYGIPYTYSDLLASIEKYRKHPNCYVNKLCYSLSGVEIPLLTITDQSQASEQNQGNKSVVVISGRVHPSQTHGSHIVNGFIEELLSETPEAQLLRSNIIFKIIPMINPDGVIAGNTRTSFSGKDLNRVYTDRTDFVYPEVLGVRDFTKKLKSKYGKKLLFYIDVHGHSTRKNSFFFGPEYPVFDEQYSKCRMLPRIFANKTDIFRYYSCKFRLSSQKEKTCRGYFNSKGIVRTYTHQTSIHCFFDFTTRKDKGFDKGSLEKLGALMMQAVHDYIKITVKLIEMEVPEPVDKKKRKKKEKQQQPQEEFDSDEMGSDKADSEDSFDDFSRNHLQMFYNRVNENREYFYEQIMAMNGLQPKKSLRDKKKMTIKELPDDSDHQKELKSPQRTSIIDLAPKIDPPPKKMKIDWSTKYDFAPRRKQFLEYERLSSVVFGTQELVQPFSSKTSAVLKNPMNTTARKTKYSLLNISPTTQMKFNELNQNSMPERYESLTHFKSTSTNLKFYTSTKRDQDTESKIIDKFKISPTKRKQFYDLQSLQKLTSPKKPPAILSEYESKIYLEKEQGKQYTKQKLRSTSLKILPRKKSIRNFRNEEEVARRKVKKNMRETCLPSKLPSLDKLIRKF